MSLIECVFAYVLPRESPSLSIVEEHLRLRVVTNHRPRRSHNHLLRLRLWQGWRIR